MKDTIRIVLILWAVNLHRTGTSDEIRFNEQIRPILAEYCLECHGPDAKKREGDLRLDMESHAKQQAIVPFQPDQSLLFKRIASHDSEQVMPPPTKGKKLTEQQITLIRSWIQQGAKFEGHWAFEPVKKPSIPVGTKGRTDIDRLLLQRLQSKGLTMSPPVSREQWIRRASFDLIGVPPTWSEVENFVNDRSPEAFEKVIDRLLDSPRYGERWGRHWLDIARYADTHGGSAIGFTPFPFSYTYRDYVIKALNSDLPYDRFILEQIAADQLDLPENHPAMAGLGFLTVGMQFRNRHDTIDDQIDVVTRGLQGLTLTCARCHDHKFDPIPTEDYYGLYATFASSQVPEAMPVIDPLPPEKPLQEYQAALEQAQDLYRDMLRDQAEVMRGRLRMQIGLYLKEVAKGTPEQDLSTAFLSYRTDDLRPLVMNRWRDYVAKMPIQDPVFGPWLRLASLPKEEFGTRAAEVIQVLEKENGELPKGTELQKLGAKTPTWNPRVLEALREKKPQSMLEVADIYGDLFGETHQNWMKSLQESSKEAAPSGTIVPDEDKKHVEINSPIQLQIRRHLYRIDTPTAISDEVASSLLNRTVSDILGGKKGAIANLHLKSPGSPPRAMVLKEDPKSTEFHVFRRGNPLDRGPTVLARTMTALPMLDSKPYAIGKRRLGLAQSIISKENPLTRRVIANWLWQHHFEQGLVRTPDDLGTRGQSPAQPQLLDYLAEILFEDGWSLKKMHRRIMLSEAYGQSAVEEEKSRALDPDNELFWRMPRRRLEMEAMRDSMLFVSGELDTTMGGRPIELLSTPVVPRRSVYGFVNRDIVSSFSSTFDGANPNACTAKRPDTNVPQQTLFALNSEFVQDRAAKLAELAEKEATAIEERIRWLYQRVYARSPDAKEMQMATHFINTRVPSDGKSGSAWQQFAHVLLASNEFVFVD